MTKRKDPADLLKPGAKISAKTIELTELVKANLHLERLEIMALIWERYPDYSEDQFRMLIWNYKLPVKPSPRRKGPAPLAPVASKRNPRPLSVVPSSDIMAVAARCQDTTSYET